MKRSPKELDTLADRLQKAVDKHNERVKKNFELYAQECRKQGKQVGQSIDIMEMVKRNEAEET